MAKLVSVYPSPCSVRCLPSHASLPSKALIGRASNRQTFASASLQPLAQSRHGILDHEFWLAASPARFSQTDSRASVDGLNGNLNKDHKPPDERILKLGKSALF